jgi:hypothetical protein
MRGGAPLPYRATLEKSLRYGRLRRPDAFLGSAARWRAAGRVHALFLRSRTVAPVAWWLQTLGNPFEQLTES